MRDEVSRFKIKHMPNEQIKVRIGIHTGPCCAGQSDGFVLSVIHLSVMSILEILICQSFRLTKFRAVTDRKLNIAH